VNQAALWPLSFEASRFSLFPLPLPSSSQLHPSFFLLFPFSHPLHARPGCPSLSTRTTRTRTISTTPRSKKSEQTSFKSRLLVLIKELTPAASPSVSPRRYRPTLDEGFEHVLVVDGVPGESSSQRSIARSEMQSSKEADLSSLPSPSSLLPPLLPSVVDESKRVKLLERLRAQFKKQGVNVEEDQIVMPWDDATNESKG